MSARNHVARALAARSLMLAAITFAAGALPGAVFTLQNGLSGAQEVPPNSSNGSGSLSALYNDETNVLTYTVTYRLGTGSTALTMAHLHGPATPTETAPPIVTLNTTNATGASSFFGGVLVLSAGEEADLKAGRIYINLHSDQFPGGELRGQLNPQAAREVIVSFPATTSQEVPRPVLNGSTPRGYLTAGFDASTRRLTVGVPFSGLTSNATMAHLHGPAAPGETAPPLFTFPNVPAARSGATVSRFSLTTEQVTILENGLLYFNLHTVNNPPGEIRAQLVLGSEQVPDDDSDGLSAEAEMALGTALDNRDTDGDTIEDGVEWGSGTNPLQPAPSGARIDADGDLLPNAVDTVPNNPDSDGDGFLDGYEVAFGTNPRSAASRPTLGDLDRDGRVDNVDAVVAMSYFIGVVPPGPSSPERGDVNRDGVTDNVDVILLFNFFLGNIRTMPVIQNPVR